MPLFRNLMMSYLAWIQLRQFAHSFQLAEHETFRRQAYCKASFSRADQSTTIRFRTRPIPALYTALSSSRISKDLENDRTIAIIGGGPSGIFSSIAAATTGSGRLSVIVLEAGRQTLAKVKISGGGRCNVMHDTSLAVPTILSKGYPRGEKELKGIFYKRFTPKDAQNWFERQGGVKLKTEADGRMFPITDDSQTIIDSLLNAASNAGVAVQKQCSVKSIEKIENDHVNNAATSKFKIVFSERDSDGKEEKELVADAVILATGSSPAGYKLAQSLGHSIVKPVPSLFTLNAANDIKVENSLLYGLAGVSVQHARVRFKLKSEENENDVESTTKKKKRSKTKYLEQEGALLVTHHGLSGPAALRLSSFGARELADAKYKGELFVHWAPSLGTVDEIFDSLWKMTTLHPKRTVVSRCPLFISPSSLPTIVGTKENLKMNEGVQRVTAIPRRLWSSMVQKAGFDIETAEWGQASKKLVRQLAALIADCPIEMTGKGTFKEEFVTAGGVDCRKSIDMTTMSSKICPGLYFCGELINVDGVTGGFNFMNCWATGYVAGKSAAENILTTADERDQTETISA